MDFNLNRQKNSFNLRNNIQNQRVDNNVTKQFKEIHNTTQNPIKNTEVWGGMATPTRSSAGASSHITDEITDGQGLERASANGNQYTHGDTMYIAGSHTAKDWYDDVTKIPFGNVRNATRYKAVRDALMENPQVRQSEATHQVVPWPQNYKGIIII